MPSAGAIPAMLLLALAGGFIFAFLWQRTWYLSLRSEGQQLYLLAAVFAIPLLLASRLLLWGTSYFCAPLAEWVGGKWAALAGPLHVSVLPTFSLAFVLGLTPLLLNLFSDRDELAGKIIMKYGSQSEKFFYETMTHKLPVAVALENRKVYVGYAWRVSPLDPRRVEDYAVRFLPVLSGYRDEQDMKLHFTTRYTEIYRQIRKKERDDLSLEDFLIVLPVKNIVSVNLYAIGVNPELFEMPPRKPPQELRSLPGVNEPKAAT